MCDTPSHLILGAVIDRGPKLDHIEDETTLLAAFVQQPSGTLLGYQSPVEYEACLR